MAGSGPSDVAPRSRTLGHADLVRLGEAHAAICAASSAQLWQVTVEQVRRVVGGDRCVLVAVDGARLEARAVDTDPGAVSRGRDLARPGLVRRAAESAQSSVVGDLHQALDQVRYGASTTRSVLTVPLDLERARVVLQLTHTEPLAFDAVDLEIAELLCGTAACIARQQRQTAEQALVASTVLSGIDDGLIVTRGPEQLVLMANDAMHRHLGCAPSDLLDRPLSVPRHHWWDEEGNQVPDEALPGRLAGRGGAAVPARTLQLLPEGMVPGSAEAERSGWWVTVEATPLVDPATGMPDLVLTRVTDAAASRWRSGHAELSMAPLPAPDPGEPSVEPGRTGDTASRLAGMAWFAYYPDDGSLTWSPEMYEIAGLDPDSSRMTHAGFLDLVHPGDREVLAVDAVPAPGQPAKSRMRMVRPDGEERDVQVWIERVVDDQGIVQRLHGAVFDIGGGSTAPVDSRRRFEIAFDGAPFGMLMVAVTGTPPGQVVRANKALVDLIGLTTGVDSQDVSAVLVADDEEEEGSLTLSTLLDASRAGDKLVRRLRRVDGSTMHAWVTVTAVPDAVSPEAFLVVHVLDVTSQRNQQRVLERIALTDAVTGLANRSMVTVRLDQALDRGDRSLCVMMLDVDRFKNVNDSLGHHIGDLFLMEVANRLRALAPNGALVARLGGDEFVLLLADTDPLDVERIAADVVSALARPYDLSSGHRVISSASVGLAFLGDRAANRHDLLRDADLALYRAKDLGRNQYVVCDAELKSQAAQRLDDEQRLRRGLEENRLLVMVQPLLDLRTGRLRAMEALVRLNDAEHGIVYPDRFVPIAEENGLVAEIDHWVIDAAFGIIDSDPRFESDPTLRMTVNVSGRTLERPDFIARLHQSVRARRADPRRLAVEITESCLLDDDAVARATLRELRAMGIAICIDDFGTGYSALSYLQTFEVDVLKVDRTFVAGLSTPGDRAEATMTAIITMAHSLGLLVVAEGVENGRQRDALVALGCDWGQGWLFGRPSAPPHPNPVLTV